MTKYVCYLCAYLISFSSCSSFHVLTEVAGPCVKMRHLEEKVVNQVTLSTEKEGTKGGESVRKKEM
jgi:hypothetical protein